MSVTHAPPLEAGRMSMVPPYKSRICLVTGEPGPVPTPVGLVAPSLNPDLSVITCVPIEQLLTESIRAPAEYSFKKIQRRMNWQV